VFLEEFIHLIFLFLPISFIPMIITIGIVRATTAMIVDGVVVVVVVVIVTAESIEAGVAAATIILVVVVVVAIGIGIGS
jgi:hypothetical protein